MNQRMSVVEDMMLFSLAFAKMTPLSISTSPLFITEAKKSSKPQTPKSARSSKVKFTNKLLKTKYEPPLRHIDGGAATSYTSLPTLQDFTSSTPSFPPTQEVKLSDFATVPKKLSEEAPQYKLPEEEIEDEEDRDDYGRYELFVVGSEAEDDDISDSEEDEEDWEEVSGDVNYIVGEVFEPGNWVDSEAEYDDEMANYTVGEVFEPKKKEKNAEGGVNEKEKGVPAVMRCFDKAKIYVKAGDGGNGVVAFRREKFVPLGGPSGGNGGRGGHVYIEVDASMNSLLPFRNKVHYRAGRGSHGQGSLMDGARGEDVTIKVAPGTVIREADKDEILLELLHPGQRALLLPGGRGGRGNAVFKCSGNKAPKIAENGEEGVEMWLELELKLVADVGIVGAPNAGKSTLLSVITAAKPEIASYPFTTLLPNLGVVSLGFDSTMVVADLPGLLEGAHRGFGLGHEFLRHTERCSALVHVIDGSSAQPELEFDAVRLELELFNPEVAEKPFIVAFNKMDLPEARENWEIFRERMNSRGIVAFCISAVKGENTKEVVSAAYELLRNVERETYVEDSREINHVAEMVKKKRQAPINEYQVSHDNSSNKYRVDGEGLRRFIQMTNWKYVDSERRFQHVLDACGVNKSLVKLGVKEGDTVIVCEMELVWHDSMPSNMKVSGSTKWPELK